MEKLAPLIYDELHRLAHHYMMRERSDCSLQTTALIHEAYLRLADVKKMKWQNRAHFFAVSARMMRRVLVDHARSRGYQKRGGNSQKVALEGDPPNSLELGKDFVRRDDALNALAEIDPRKARVVELRFFGGLSVEETAAVLKVATTTVMGDWRMAKLWLMKELMRE